jgi:hypothetical protein
MQWEDVKWNCLNGEYKNISNYYKGIGHNTLYDKLSVEERNMFHVPRQFNKNYYNVIEMFQGERTIDAPLHIKDLHASRDNVYM